MEAVITDENFVEPKRTSVEFNCILFLGIAKLRIDRNMATKNTLAQNVKNPSSVNFLYVISVFQVLV